MPVPIPAGHRRIEGVLSELVGLKRQTLQLRPDPARVVIRPFKPAVEPRDLNPTDKTRANHIVDRILSLDEDTARAQLADVLEHFENRHNDVAGIFAARANEMDDALAPHETFCRVQQLLLGSYFLQENSFEAAALFNPSIVLHPDQTGAPPGGCRVILSLRAVGEGHVSSLTFRSGTVAQDGTIAIDPPARCATVQKIIARRALPEGEIIDITFDPARDLSERVIFPATPAQSNGIEDARFVKFSDGGNEKYYATFTAYSGRAIASELIETSDFITFRMTPLRGSAVQNKGMALFPRKINGRYAMIARQDNENLSLIYSEDLHEWSGGQTILRPRFAWEFVQIGNCGSPIELDNAWLLLTHGVGPMRKYAIGAVLLDKADPSKVIARLAEPLVGPTPAERDGYVPNVVYTCGALIHGDEIILPYAVSDTFTTFATLHWPTLISAMGSP
jgi:predicted GH43/DUF377 family glycosyl hydrolase